MKVKDLLCETPSTIADLDNPLELDLLDKVKNRALYQDYSSKKYQYKKKIFDLTDYAAVYQYKTEFFCLDTKRGKVTYYMRYKVGDNKLLGGQYVWQSMVWTLGIVHQEYLVGIASKVFFEYLLPEFKVIVTDGEQTWKGQRFWQILIGSAFNKNLNVYFIDFQAKKLVKLNDADELDDFQEKYDIWGLTKIHELRRMVITDKQLTETN